MSTSTIADRIHEETTPPYDVMLDPSLLSPQRALDEVADSTLFDARAQTTFDADMEPVVSDIYIPATFVRLLEESTPFDLRRTEAWTFFTRQAKGAFGEDILDLIDRRNIRTFEQTDAEAPSIELDRLNWPNAIGGGERYELLQDILTEELLFMLSSSLLTLRRPYALNAMRDAGVPTVDIGNAPTRYSGGGRGDRSGNDPDSIGPGKFAGFAISNAMPAIDPIWGSVGAAAVDCLLYKIDP